MAASYRIPVRHHAFELIVQNSRFLADAVRVDSRESVVHELEKRRKLHPKANHICYGFIAGAPGDSQQWGFGDDGEPSGTAGKPILNVLQYAGMGEVLVSVTRYFGGVKLGTGGLVRAYSAATKGVLEELECVSFEASERFVITCGYSLEPLLRYEFSILGITDFEVVYDHVVSVCLPLTAPQEIELRKKLSGGQFQMQLEQEMFVAEDD